MGQSGDQEVDAHRRQTNNFDLIAKHNPHLDGNLPGRIESELVMNVGCVQALAVGTRLPAALNRMRLTSRSMSSHTRILPQEATVVMKFVSEVDIPGRIDSQSMRAR